MSLRKEMEVCKSEIKKKIDQWFSLLMIMKSLYMNKITRLIIFRNSQWMTVRFAYVEATYLQHTQIVTIISILFSIQINYSSNFH